MVDEQEMNMAGTLSINMSQMSKFNVCADNVRLHENIMMSKGKFFTLDARAYIEELNLFGIFYTFTQ
jgi:hypothetical protein